MVKLLVLECFEHKYLGIEDSIFFYKRVEKFYGKYENELNSTIIN